MNESSKDSDANLVSKLQENISVWQWARWHEPKWSKNLPHLWCHSQKTLKPKTKKFFSLQTRSLAESFEGSNCFLAQSSEELGGC